MFKKGNGAIIAPKTKIENKGLKEVHDRKADMIMSPLYEVHYYVRSTSYENVEYGEFDESRREIHNLGFPFIEYVEISNSPLIRRGIEIGVLKIKTGEKMTIKQKNDKGEVIGFKQVISDNKINIFIENFFSIDFSRENDPRERKKNFNSLLNDGFYINEKGSGEMAFKPFSWTPSKERNSSFDFVQADQEAIKILLDTIGGGIFLQKIKEYISTPKLQKLGARLGLFSAPALDAGKIGWNEGTGVLILNKELKGPSDFSDSDIDVDGITNDRSTFDGIAYMLDQQMADCLNAAAGRKIISPSEAARYSCQMRADKIYAKVLMRADRKIVFRYKLEYIYANYNKEDYMVVGNPDNIVAIFDSNAAKIIDVSWLEENMNINKNSMTIYLLNIAKAHSAGIGGQLLNKMLAANEAATLEWLRKTTHKGVVASIDKASEGHGSLYNKDVYFTDAILNSVKENDSLFDQLVTQCPIFAHSIVRNTIRGINSNVAGLRAQIGDTAVSLTAMFDDSYIVTNKAIDGLLKVTEEGQVEVYCPDLIGVAEACNMAGVKYPAPGLFDSQLFKRVTLKQVDMRIIDLAKKGVISEEQAQALHKNFLDAPFGCVIIAPVNFMKRKLAGMDTDYDSLVLFWEQTIVNVLTEGLKNEAQRRGLNNSKGWSGPIPYMIYGDK